MKESPSFQDDPALLLTLDEDQWFERKSFRIAPKDLAKTIVAMANAEGGVIAVGITDRRFDGQPTSVQQNDLHQVTFDHTDPTVRVDVEALDVAEGASVLLFNVLPSDRGDCQWVNAPLRSRGGCCGRLGFRGDS